MKVQIYTNGFYITTTTVNEQTARELQNNGFVLKMVKQEDNKMGYELLDIEFFDTNDDWEAVNDYMGAYTDYANSDEYDNQGG